MAEEQPSLHIDTDWKKQALEEKKRLAEQEQQRQSAAAPTGPAGVVSSPATTGAARPQAQKPAAGERATREMPPASLQTLVQSILTQVLFYLGEIAARGQRPMIDLDLAKHHIDTLGVLEEKTKGNLAPEEQQVLDGALYDVRMRYISAASRYAELP